MANSKNNKLNILLDELSEINIQDQKQKSPVSSERRFSETISLLKRKVILQDNMVTQDVVVKNLNIQFS